MKKTKSANGIVALVFICLLLLFAIFNWAYDSIFSENSFDIRKDMLFCFIAVLCAGFGISHYRMFRSRTRLQDGLSAGVPEESHSLDGLRYKIAMEQLNCTIFDYGIREDIINLRYDTSFHTDITEQFGITPESMTQTGIIHPDYAEEFLRAFDNIRGGKPSACCSVQIRNTEKQYRWCKVMLTCIYDNHQHTDCAFGIIEDITEQKETEKRFVKEHQYREAILSSAIMIYKLNLTKNKFKKGHENWRELFGILPTDNYAVMIDSIAKSGIFPEDSEQFLNTFSLDSVMSSFSDGQTEITLEYRHQPLKGPVGWVRCTLHLLRDPFTQDIKGIAYIKDINKQKKKEIEMQYRAERDSLSGLYNRGAIRQLITDFLNSEEGKANQHALLIVDIDNFKSINDNHGHIQGDTVLKKVADCMRTIFRSSDIIGRLGGDEYILFLKNISKPEAAVRKAEELNEVLKSLSVDNNPDCNLSASIGIAQCPGNGSTFDELYHNADIALYQAKKSGKNNYVLFPSQIATVFVQK